MGTFAGHFVPGVAFAVLGLWHVVNTIKSFRRLKRAPATNFSSATWFPLPGATSTCSFLKHLELYLLLSFSVLAIALQVADYPLLTFSFKPDNYEHATMYLHLAIYCCVALAVDMSPSSSSCRATSSLVGALAASVFAQELFLLRLHSADHVGLEGHYHWLLQLVVATSLLATVAATRDPSSFVAALVRSISLLLQGLWFVVMAFALWVPRLVPKGCHAVAAAAATAGGHGSSAVACWSEEASRRAMALANLQFSWTIAGVTVLTACWCLWPDVNCMAYRQLEPAAGNNLEVRHLAGDQGDGLKQSRHV